MFHYDGEVMLEEDPMPIPGDFFTMFLQLGLRTMGESICRNTWILHQRPLTC